MTITIRKTGTLSNGALWAWNFGESISITDRETGHVISRIRINNFDFDMSAEDANIDMNPVQTEIDTISLDCADSQDAALMAFRYQVLLCGKSELRKALRKLKFASIKAYREGRPEKKEAVRAMLIEQFRMRIAKKARGMITCTDAEFSSYRDSQLIRDKAESMLNELLAL